MRAKAAKKGQEEEDDFTIVWDLDLKDTNQSKRRINKKIACVAGNLIFGIALFLGGYWVKGKVNEDEIQRKKARCKKLEAKNQQLRKELEKSRLIVSVPLNAKDGNILRTVEGNYFVVGKKYAQGKYEGESGPLRVKLSGDATVTLLGGKEIRLEKESEIKSPGLLCTGFQIERLVEQCPELKEKYRALKLKEQNKKNIFPPPSRAFTKLKNEKEPKVPARKIRARLVRCSQ